MNVVQRTLLNCSRVVVRTLVTGLHARAVSYSVDEATQARDRKRWAFVSVCCGFPKDFAYGPSTANDPFCFGDDACFVASHKKGDFVGVADGVGGWRNYGIDPSVFSRSLMHLCSELVESGEIRPNAPAELLAAAYEELNNIRCEEMSSTPKSSSGIIGSSTACVVSLDKSTRQLHTANIGDSGFVVVRDGAVVHRSQEQVHYFNAPYQLSLAPQNAPHFTNFLCDSPDCAQTTTFALQEGDVIVVATDGLFDNLPNELIVSELDNLESRSAVSLQAVCNSLALQARRLAHDRNYVSPFAQKAKENGLQMTGGKPDDITVVLVLVTAEHTDA